MILEEGNQPYTRCPQCDMFVSHKSLNGNFTKPEIFRWGLESKQHRLAEEETRAVAETAITEYGTPLTPVTCFK